MSAPNLDLIVPVTKSMGPDCSEAPASVSCTSARTAQWRSTRSGYATRACSPYPANHLRSVFEPLQRLEYPGFAGDGRLAFLLFFLDDFLGRVGDEFLVIELGIDPLDVGVGLAQFLVEPRLLGRKVDHAFQRQSRDLAAHQQRHRTFRRVICEGNVGEPGHPLDHVVPAL